MGDFDTVLERLLMDEPFRAALAADPDAALAGYRLSPDEVGLLRSQVSAGGGEQRTVESRNTKSSLFGMLGSIVGLAEGAVSAPGLVPPQPLGGGGAGQIGHLLNGPGGPVGHGTLGAAGTGTLEPAGTETFGPGATETFGPGATETFGPGATETFGPGATETFGPAGTGTLGPAVSETMGTAPGGMQIGNLLGPGDHIAAGHHPHIDADGDGHWDQYTAVRHSDGSIDIYEDRNHDGRADFIGHDRNHDGLVESADYDNNFDGMFETHMRDTNGDGWLDTRMVTPDPPSGAGTS